MCRNKDCGQVGGARLGYWATLVTVVIAAFMSGDADAQERRLKIEPFVLPLAHVSDAGRGPPLFNPKPGCEPTTDFSGIGATLTWPRVELDVAHGAKWRDYWCGEPWRQPRESGTFLSLKVYPWRR